MAACPCRVSSTVMPAQRCLVILGHYKLTFAYRETVTDGRRQYCYALYTGPNLLHMT